jgi:hypothetical protein
MGAILSIVVGGILCGAKRANEAASTMAPLGFGTIGALETALVSAIWAKKFSGLRKRSR